MAFDFKKIFSSLKNSVPQVPKRVMGIDIGSSSIKVVEVEQTDVALTLRTYGELQLGPYADKDLGEAVTLEPQRLTEAVVDVMRESGVQATSGVLALPLGASFVTVVPISVTATEDIDSKIRVEARKYIPVPLSEVILDWSELDQYGDKNSQVHEVLLAAIQSEAYRRYQKLMSDVGLASEPAEIELFSTVRGIFRPEDTTIGIIDLGAQTSKLYIAAEGNLERIHRVYEGGAACTKRISKMLSVSFREAEIMKRNYTPGDAAGEDIKKAYSSTIERSAQEFKRVIEQYEARKGAPLGRVVITGGAAAFPGVEAHLSDLFSRDVVKVRPFGKLAYPAFMEDTLQEAGLSFAPALGAAIRPFYLNN